MRDSFFDFIVSSDHLEVVITTRVAVYSGRYGSGKTALAVHDAYRLARMSAIKYIYSNLWLRENIEREDNQFHATMLKDAAILLDEAWLYLALDTSAKELKTFLAYLRKQNLYLLLPSVLPLQRYVERAAVRIRRYYSFSWLGIPAWIYRWEIGQSRNQASGYWWWWRYSKVFDKYDTTQRDFSKIFLYRL